MTNYNERLDKILEEFVDGCDCRIDEGQAYLHLSEFAAKKLGDCSDKSNVRAKYPEMQPPSTKNGCR